MSFRDRLRTVFRLFALFTVMVAVALASAITTIRLTIHGHQEETPNLVGVSLDAAEKITSGMGLELIVEDKLYNNQYPANQIISQVPSRGSRVKMGQHIHVLVSLGAPRVHVPELVGETARTAQITAVERGLTLGDIVQVHWPAGDPDQVLAQDPPPTKAEVQSPAVNILVSLGEPPPAYMCPSFVGSLFSDASKVLDKSGFKIGQITPVTTDQVPAGTILTQIPLGGSKIGADAVFNFQVAGLPSSIPPVTASPGAPLPH
ncbi:MAG TPA: PASTA domain-containing protein [Terriglobia bacterium]|nr:PASTA domain-containing protein [Terriglobia bacterium]